MTEPREDILASSTEDIGIRLLKGLVRKLLSIVEGDDPMTASEGELIRKLLSDSSVTLAQVKRGDFGPTAQKAAEEYPFPQGPTFVGSQAQGTA